MKFNRIGIAKRLILASNFKGAKKLLLPLAKNGHSKAQLILGYMYFGGDFTMSPNEAKYWLEKASIQGIAEAMAMLATTDFKQGTWTNFSNSKKQISKVERAAKKGSAEAQRWLATTYAHGEVVEVDIEKVVYWDTKAAEQGLSESQHDLGVMWMSGEAGFVDMEKALYWYKRCVDRDHNVVDAEWAFKRIIEFYEGKFGEEYKNIIEASRWQECKNAFLKLPYRDHPDWFYDDLYKIN